MTASLPAEPQLCSGCGMESVACGCSVEDRAFDAYDETDEHEEAMYACHGFFESPSPKAVFVCGAVGSEDCDECPMNNWLGLTNKQIDSLEAEYDGK